MVCGLPGWSLEEAGCIPGRWPRPLPLGHSVTTSTQYKYSCWVWHLILSPCQCKGKDQNPRGFMASCVFSYNISFKSRIACWFSLDLKFQVWKQNTKSFHQTFFFNPLKVILLYLCSALSFISLDSILPINFSQGLGEQELLFAFPYEKSALERRCPGLVLNMALQHNPFMWYSMTFLAWFLVYWVILVRF